MQIDNNLLHVLSVHAFLDVILQTRSLHIGFAAYGARESAYRFMRLEYAEGCKFLLALRAVVHLFMA